MTNEKRCPFKMAGNIHPGYCAKSECMIWCSYSQSCAISTIADILADSTICNSYFVQTSEEDAPPDPGNQNPGKQKNNGDKFRSMSDYELADTMLHMAACLGHCPPGKDYFSCNGDFPCKDCWLEWVQQPAEEETK